jgi:hypothetical protein
MSSFCGKCCTKESIPMSDPICPAAEFEKICATFVPSPRKLPAYEFGRFSRAWNQPRIVPDGYDPAEFLRGWDDVNYERNHPEIQGADDD